MNLSKIIYLISLFIITNAIKCSNHEILQNYKLLDHFATGEIKKNTPPSQTIESWWLNICEENIDNFQPNNNCEKNDLLCGITKVSLQNQENLLTTKIIEFNNRLAFDIDTDESGQTLYITLKSKKWGSYNLDANIDWQCNDNLKTDEITDSVWLDEEINLSIRGPSACLKDKNKNDNNNNNNDNNNNNSNNGNNNSNEGTENKKNGSGLSWFTWLFLYALLFTLFYLLITSYMNSRGGNLEDFRQEFIDRSTQLLVSLPSFCKEVISKIIGSRSTTSERGGYSAV